MLKVEYIDSMGGDLSVVNAARVSFDKVSEWDVSYDCKEFCGVNVLSNTDTRLIKYLAKHNHWTPFSHTAITLRMSAPVPIRTQAFKHKAGFTENEESRRYISSRPEVFIPDAFRVAADSVKQGSGGVHDDSAEWVAEYTYYVNQCVQKYMDMVDANICPEQARLILPQGCIVNWIWTGNLTAFARFYNQRADPHAQKEVRDLAHMVGDIIAPLYPVGWAALTDNR